MWVGRGDSPNSGRWMRPLEVVCGYALLIVAGLVVSRGYPRLGFFILFLPLVLTVVAVLAVPAFLICGALTGDVRRGFKTAVTFIAILLLGGCAFLWWYCLAGVPIRDRATASATPKESGKQNRRARPQAQGTGTLRLFDPVVSQTNKKVLVNGVDTLRPTMPFVFEWGDGTTTKGFFPQEKTYRAAQVYNIRVFATHSDGSRSVATLQVDLR